MPLSWRHYVYGMRHLERAAARGMLRAHHAAAAVQYKEEDRKSFLREYQRLADH